MAELFPQMFGIPGVLAFLINPPSIGGRFSSSPVEYVLQAENYEELSQAVGIMMGKASELGYLINLDSDLRLNKPQLDVSIDRERAAQLGVSVTDIGTTLETLLGGRVITNFKRGTKQYDVIAQMIPSDRARPDVIEGVYLRTGSGGLVQLANVVKVEETVAPKELNHFNRVRSATIYRQPRCPGMGLGQALDDLDRIAEENLPRRDPDRSRRTVVGVPHGQRQPVFPVPLGPDLHLPGAGGPVRELRAPLHDPALGAPGGVRGPGSRSWLFGQTLNVFSQIGLIMLIGLVTKNSILIVEFANQLRNRGKSVMEGVAEAARTRLRPILMTSFATIFGVLPIALGLGAGGESRAPLGIAVVGGMLFSTFLTLILVPVVYSLLGRFTKASQASKDIEKLLEEEHDRGTGKESLETA